MVPETSPSWQASIEYTLNRSSAVSYKIMKISRIMHISVRGTTSPTSNNYNKTNTNSATIHVGTSSSKTISRIPQKRPTPVTTEPTKSIHMRVPPPPPQTRRTIHHLALQLEYQISHHTGYIPNGAVPIAFIQQLKAKKSIFRPSNKATIVKGDKWSKSAMKCLIVRRKRLSSRRKLENRGGTTAIRPLWRRRNVGYMYTYRLCMRHWCNDK